MPATRLFANSLSILGCQRLRLAIRRKSSFSVPIKTDGNSIHNSILLALPPAERDFVFAKSELVTLPLHTILNEMAEPVEFAYFMNSGLASILTVLSDGKSVEVGMTGREGFVGFPLIAGLRTSPTRALLQVDGSAFKISAQDMRVALGDCPNLEKRLLRYSYELSVQTTFVAACNRLHEVEERLARWLLMSQDRVGGSVFPLTQEFISHMLGTRRATVTVAAGILQKAGMITYTRGQVKIEDRKRLEETSCECYSAITRQIEGWKKDSL
jgi:CRP-like cAMP-binding protein